MSRAAAAAAIALTGALAVALLPAIAASASPPAWTVDKSASFVRFNSSMAGESFTGAFRRWDADIRFDPANLPASSVNATIEVASAATGLIDLLLAAGGELVTVLVGECIEAAPVESRLLAHVHDRHPGSELVSYRTGHRGDALLIGVE